MRSVNQEGLDRTHMDMPYAQDTLLDEITTVNSNVIVVLSAGSAIEMLWYSYVKKESYMDIWVDRQAPLR